MLETELDSHLGNEKYDYQISTLWLVVKFSLSLKGGGIGDAGDYYNRIYFISSYWNDIET